MIPKRMDQAIVDKECDEADDLSHHSEASLSSSSSSRRSIDELIGTFEWFVMLISFAEEEVRFAQNFVENNGSELLQAMGDLLHMLSISFSRLCNNNYNASDSDTNQSSSSEHHRHIYSQGKSYKKLVMHTLVMIRLYLTDTFSSGMVGCSYTRTIALTCLSILLESILAENWISDENRISLNEEEFEINGGRWSKRADLAVSFFASICDTVEVGLKHALPVINDGFDSAGHLVKQNISPIPKEKQPKIPEKVIKSTELARQASFKAHEASKGAFVGIGHAATKAVNVTAERIGSSKDYHQHYSERKDALSATGRVALAGFGAFVSVSEALFDTSLAIVNKAACTTADVIGHRYGDSTGKIVEHGADVVTNAVRTVKFATSLRKMAHHAESVAKNNGKAELALSKKINIDAPIHGCESERSNMDGEVYE